MANPRTKAEFAEYCLRKLGKPVIEINVSEEQVDDRIDEALKYFADYHFDGVERIYYKHIVSDADRPGYINKIEVIANGEDYDPSDTITLVNGGQEVVLSMDVDSFGGITGVTVVENGPGNTDATTVQVNTSTGSGAQFKVVPGDGAIWMPENVLGAVQVFPIGYHTGSSLDMFNIQYQIALNDLHTLTSHSMVPYYMMMEHLSLIQELLVGRQPIRYNRIKNKLFIDMNWKKVRNGQYLLIEAFEVVDPEEYAAVWGDRWLQNYATAKIKYQWASNLSKFTDMTLPGGMKFNADRMLTDAQAEIEKMEDAMQLNYMLPSIDIVG